MGNDGGSIPSRRELVKEAARNPTTSELKETQKEQQQHLWNTDPLTNRALEKPVVSDALGRLFNKESVLEYLIASRSEDNDDATRVKLAEQEGILRGVVKNLRDVVDVQFEVDESGKDGERCGSKGSIVRAQKWVCPVTQKELGPAAKAVYIVPCGHAFAEVAVREVSGEKCLTCDQQYAPNDLIPILPNTDTDIARLTLRQQTLKEQGLRHSLQKLSGKKKDKKRKRDPEAESDEKAEKKTAKKAPKENGIPQDGHSGIKNAATATLTAKVMEEQEARSKLEKQKNNENLSSLFSSSKSGERGKDWKNKDFMTRGYAPLGKK